MKNVIKDKIEKLTREQLSLIWGDAIRMPEVEDKIRIAVNDVVTEISQSVLMQFSELMEALTQSHGAELLIDSSKIDTRTHAQRLVDVITVEMGNAPTDTEGKIALDTLNEFLESIVVQTFEIVAINLRGFFMQAFMHSMIVILSQRSADIAMSINVRQMRQPEESEVN